MSHAPTDTLNRRHQAVRRELESRGLDALVVTALPNILYLTNFTGSSAILVVTATRLAFITDFRYVTALSSTQGTPYECPALDLVVVEGSYDGTLAGVLTSGPVMRTVSRPRFVGEPPPLARELMALFGAPSSSLWNSSSRDCACARTTMKSRRRARPAACRRGRDGGAGGPAGPTEQDPPWPSTGGSVRPLNARRLIPLWPAGRTPPSCTPAQRANH